MEVDEDDQEDFVKVLRTFIFLFHFFSLWFSLFFFIAFSNPEVECHRIAANTNTK